MAFSAISPNKQGSTTKLLLTVTVMLNTVFQKVK